VNRPNEFYWLLCEFYLIIIRCEPDRPRRTVWQSYAHGAAIKADPSYPTFIQDREALATAPVYEVHVPLPGDPQRTVEAPVTEVEFYKTDDKDVDPDAKRMVETQEMIRHVIWRAKSFQIQGYVANVSGIAIENGSRGISLTGWRSIEVRLLVLFSRPFVPFVQRLNPFFSLDRTT
jgi:hypothetical protein